MSSRVLSNGREAEIEHDAHGWKLKVGGFVQSHVTEPGTESPLVVMRWLSAAALAALGGAEDARALHIGGGAATLPRLLQHALPGLRQRVIELEPELVALVQELAPPPAGVELVVGDGRAALEANDELHALLTIDVFDGGRVPAPFTTVECFRAARAALEPGGLLAINSADGPPLTFVRAQLRTLHEVFPHVAMITRGSTLALRPGNIVLLASDRELPLDAIRERLGDRRPRAVVASWRRLERFIADTAPAVVTDATASDYAEPPLSRTFAPGSIPASLTDPLDEPSSTGGADTA